MRLIIKGGRLFDPAHGWEGEEGDLYLADGRIVARLATADRVIVASGLAVVPAGIDMRASVAAWGRNQLRLWGGLPTSRELAQTYLRLGYTQVHEPGATLETAAYVHRELAALPGLDTSLSLTLNLRDVDLWLKQKEQWAAVAEACRYFLQLTRALTLRVVEPFVSYRQEFYRYRCSTLAEVLSALAEIAHHLGERLTLEARPELLLLEPVAASAFHLGGLGPALLSEQHYLGAVAWLQQGATADLGLLPPTLPVPRPPIVKLDLGRSEPEGWPQVEAAAAPWALRLARDPAGAAAAFSGAEVLLTPPSAYPDLWATLLAADGGGPDPSTGALGPWTFGELIRRTRWLPARYLGLTDRGHLQPGAKADLALYDLPRQETPAAWRQCLSHCRYLIKAGEIVIDNYQLTSNLPDKVTYFRPGEVAPNRLVQEICRNRSYHWGYPTVGAFPDLRWQAVA